MTDPFVTHMMQFFEYEHLPLKLKNVVFPIRILVLQLPRLAPQDHEYTVGVRKLLEAKDCFVRARSVEIITSAASPPPEIHLHSFPIAITSEILMFFERDHTWEKRPAEQREILETFAQLAKDMSLLISASPELIAGLRKLLEAQDCFLRAVENVPTLTPEDPPV